MKNTKYRPCIYCGDPNHEATAPSETCIKYLKTGIERLSLIEAAARGVADSGPLCNGLSDKNSVNALRGSLGLKHI